MSEEPVNQEINRNPDGTFPPGVSGNPNGRPKGKSLKEYDRERFAKMTDEEKEKFLGTLNPIDRYKMAEGNPHQTEDITSDGEKIVPIYGSISGHNSDAKGIPPQQENKGSIGGDIGK